MISLPWCPREVKAPERVLDAIYRAAYAGLKDDSLATVAGLDPANYRQLYELDPQVKEHFLRGRADSELEHALKLAQASREGDAKASLAILQHVHGWTAKQQIEVSGSVNATLETALDGVAIELLAKIRQQQPRVLEHDNPPQEQNHGLAQPQLETRQDARQTPHEVRQDARQTAPEGAQQDARAGGVGCAPEAGEPVRPRRSRIESDNADLFARAS